MKQLMHKKLVEIIKRDSKFLEIVNPETKQFDNANKISMIFGFMDFDDLYSKSLSTQSISDIKNLDDETKYQLGKFYYEKLLILSGLDKSNPNHKDDIRELKYKGLVIKELD